MVGLVQLVRALVCGTRNHGFESISHPNYLLAPYTGGVAKGKARVFDSRIVGPNPATPAIWFTSSVGRALDFNQGVFVRAPVSQQSFINLSVNTEVFVLLCLHFLIVSLRAWRYQEIINF